MKDIFCLFRGHEKYDNPDKIYVERLEPNGHSTVVLSTDFFEKHQQAIISAVEDFEIKENYMFATKKIVSKEVPIHIFFFNLFMPHSILSSFYLFHPILSCLFFFFSGQIILTTKKVFKTA